MIYKQNGRLEGDSPKSLDCRLLMKNQLTQPKTTALRRLGHLLLFAIVFSIANARSADPFLKTSGNDIRDERGKGDVVMLRGVNLGSWLVFEGWMCPMDCSKLTDDWSVRETLTRRFDAATRDALLADYEDAWITEADLDNIASLGMNVVRLPFWYLNVQDEDGTWRADAFTRMDWLIENAWKRRIYTIIDFHGAPGGQSDSDSTGRLRKENENNLKPEFWTKKKHAERAAEIWKRVAGRYKGNPAVAAYDLLNEPTAAPNREALWALYDRFYKAIRAVDHDHIVSMEGCWGGQVDGKLMNWGWDVLPAPEDFGWTNVLYQMHSYEWDWNSLEKQRRNTASQIKDWRKHMNWNVPCLIGEFNVMAREEAWRYTIEEFCANNMSWTIWTYKATHGSGQDSWGVYNYIDPAPPKPNIQDDDADTISDKWQAWDESAFQINPMLKRYVAMPIPVNDEYIVMQDLVLAVSAPGVLLNDKHMNLGTPRVKLTARKVGEPTHGKVNLNPDGSFKYTPEAGFSGTDTFRYRVFDGRLDSALIGTVTITVK